MRTIAKLFIIALGLLVVAQYSIIPGLSISGFKTALIVAIVMAIVNVLIKPILLILTLPLNIITLGLFTLVINAFLFWGVASVIKGIIVTGFVPALLGGIVLSILSFIANAILSKD